MADLLSFIPVTQTLRIYNHVTTSQTKYPGRGSVLSQIVTVGEYYALLGHGVDLVIRLLGLFGWIITDAVKFRQTPLAQGLYTNILFAGYFRVLCHSILLNILDEAYIIGVGTSGNHHDDDDDDHDGANNNNNSSARPSHGSSNGPTVETVNDDEMAVVPLVGKSY